MTNLQTQGSNLKFHVPTFLPLADALQEYGLSESRSELLTDTVEFRPTGSVQTLATNQKSDQGEDMSFEIIIHYDNMLHFTDPHLWVWYAGSDLPDDFEATSSDNFGSVFVVTVKHSSFEFKFKAGSGPAGPWENDAVNRSFKPIKSTTGIPILNEIWCRRDKAFVYPMLPRAPEVMNAAAYLVTLSPKLGLYWPDTGGLSGLGATPLADEGVLFGLYHPNAARVYVFGSFNDWQHPGHNTPAPTKFQELKLYSGYFGLPNLWLSVIPQAKVGDEYKFCVQGGVSSDEQGRFQQNFTDPYARQLGHDFDLNNSVVVDPTVFAWSDATWQTPDKSRLIIYEFSCGFIRNQKDVDQQCDPTS